MTSYYVEDCLNEQRERVPQTMNVVAAKSFQSREAIPELLFLLVTKENYIQLFIQNDLAFTSPHNKI